MPQGTPPTPRVRREGTARKASRAQSAARANDPRPLLTIAETAAILGVTRQTVYMLRQRGELRSISVGRHVRFHPVDLDRYMGVAS